MLELEKGVSSQITFRRTTHYQLNRSGASIQIIQRAESIIDNFIYEILDKCVDDQCHLSCAPLAVNAAFALGKSAPIDTDSALESVGLVVCEEEWYTKIPFHFRR